MKKSQTEQLITRTPVERIQASPQQGLTFAQAAERMARGWAIPLWIRLPKR